MLRNKLPKIIIYWTVGVAVLLICIALASSQVEAMQEMPLDYPTVGYENEYFYITGHYLRGPFQRYFHDHGGLRIFGYPQTEVYYDPGIGLWVQYFDNVRMEWHPQNPEKYRIQLGLLADILGHYKPAVISNQLAADSTYRRYFPETGHWVSYAFLLHYDEHGGLDIFGYPISEPLIENERIVQYFQRARMEWYPERPLDDRVLSGALGLAYIEQYGVPEEHRKFLNPGHYRTPETPESPALVLHTVGAFAQKPTIAQGESQVVTVYVADVNGRTIEGASVTVAVHFQRGTLLREAVPTDSTGITKVTFENQDPSSGHQVLVDATVRFNGRMKETQTFFISWD